MGSFSPILINSHTREMIPLAKFFDVEQFLRDLVEITDLGRRPAITKAMVSLSAVGIGIWTYLNAEVWTPLQRYYWNEYLNTEMYRASQGEYWILDTVDHRGQRRMATTFDVVPAARHGRQLVPFSLSAQARQAGATDLVVDTVRYGSEQMHQKLAQSIYHDQSVTELSWTAWGGGLFARILGIGWAIRRNFAPRDLINDGRRLKGPQIVTVKEFNRWSRAEMALVS